MTVVLLAVVVFAVVMGAMALGLLFSGRGLRGSCGGAGSVDCACKPQGRVPATCPKKRSEKAQPNASARSLDIVQD